MNVCFFGSYQEKYPRNQIIRKGLAENDIGVFECNVPFELGLRFWKRYIRLSVLHRTLKDKYDYLFVPEMNHKNMPLAYIFSKLYKKPLIFDPFISRYDTDVMDRKRVNKYSTGAIWSYILDKLGLKMADIILADTRQHLYYFRDTFEIPEDKMRVLYVGADDRLFNRERYKSSFKKNDIFTVCFYGSFVPLQGVEYIVKATNVLRKEDIHFKILGRGQTFPMIEDMAKKLRLSNITFIPPMPIEKLPHRIMEADILLGIFGNTPKTQRVIPNKVFQSMAMGKPVITGDTPAIKEILTDRKNILLCKCADENSLAETILELKENPGLRQKIAESGYSLIKKHLTPIVIGKKLIKELNNWNGKIR